MRIELEDDQEVAVVVREDGVPPPQFHVTGTQRSGHNMIALALVALAQVVWYKQHARGQWELKAILYYGERPGEEWEKYEMKNIGRDDFPHREVSIDGGKTFIMPNAIRVTEFHSPDRFYKNHEEQKHSVRKFNVIRDPRNVLASAIGKGWDKEHCSLVLDANKFQYNCEELTTQYVNLSYDKWLVGFCSSQHGTEGQFIPSAIGPFSPQILDCLKATMTKSGNSSFGTEHNISEFFVRYTRPEIVSSPIFQSLWSRALEIYNDYYKPFLCTL